MASCECCWADAFDYPYGSNQPERYRVVLREHESKNCVCTQDTIEGQKARAGQFWDEKTQTDKRTW